MRRIVCLTLLALGSGLLAAAAGAAPAPNTAGTLSVKRGDGQLTLNMRGAIVGRLARGEVDVLIPAWRSCDDLKVWGAETTDSAFEPISIGEPAYICSFTGRDIRFRLVGEIRLEVRRARDLFVSAVGRGTGEIDGAGGRSDGVWALDDDELTSLPDVMKSFTLGRPTDVVPA